MVNHFDIHTADYQKTMDDIVSPFGVVHDEFVAYKVQVCKEINHQFGVEVNTLLDFGTGIGLSIPYFSKLFPGTTLLGSDVCSTSLDMAKSQFSEMATFLDIAAGRIPLASNSVDLVFAACVFHHIKQAERQIWIEEIKRVLRKGGVLIIFEHNPLHMLTRYAVRRCPWDKDAVLLYLKETMNLLIESSFGSVDFKYQLFLPPSWNVFKFVESYLEKIPLGAQYMVYGIK
jgi:ubiquinone/menaquinone biosynthesis C-methylase UbiE